MATEAVRAEIWVEQDKNNCRTGTIVISKAGTEEGIVFEFRMMGNHLAVFNNNGHAVHLSEQGKRFWTDLLRDWCNFTIIPKNREVRVRGVNYEINPCDELEELVAGVMSAS